MEFDNNAPISDEQRKLAETKRVVIEPVHSNIEPETRPDGEVAAHHLVEPPAANTSNDIEQTAIPIQPSESMRSQPAPIQKTSGKIGPIIGICGVILLIFVLVALFINVK